MLVELMPSLLCWLDVEKDIRPAESILWMHQLLQSLRDYEEEERTTYHPLKGRGYDHVTVLKFCHLP